MEMLSTSHFFPSLCFTFFFCKTSKKCYCIFKKIYMLFDIFLFVFAFLPSSWFGHPIHPHGGKLRRGTRHRHAHAQDWSYGSCGRKGRGLHSPHQQRHNICRRPREELRGSKSGRFQRTDGYSNAGELDKSILKICFENCIFFFLG